MKYPLLFGLFLLAQTAFAQHPLEGLWQGEMVDSFGTHRFELLLKLEKNRVTGRSYYYHEDRLITEMDVKGKFYRDQSISLYDIHLVKGDDLTGKDPFKRTYQLAFRRSAFGHTLKGFWQIHNGQIGKQLRKLGRLDMRQVVVPKA